MRKFLNTKIKDMKDMKAITLIALVITIVVLIILAAVAINLSLGNNGIFNRAKTAKEQYQNAQDYEETEIAKSKNTIDGFIDGNRDDNNDAEWKTLSTGVKYIKRNGYVTVKSNMITTVNIPASCTISNNISLGTLPDGYRPDSTICFPITYGSYNGDCGCCTINTDGTMKITGRNAGTYVTGVFVFPVL